MSRDRDATKKKIIAALARLLAEQGFGRVGVNALAREAGVDKVLIYRYFGGLPGVVGALAEEADFWPSADDLLPEAIDRNNPAESVTALFKNHLRGLLARPLTQEIMRWELLEKNDLTRAMAEVRETSTRPLTEPFGLDPDSPRDALTMAVAAVIHAGLSYLVLRAKTADVYMGLDLTSDDGWSRVEAAVAALIGAYYSAEPAPKEE